MKSCSSSISDHSTAPNPRVAWALPGENRVHFAWDVAQTVTARRLEELPAVFEAIERARADGFHAVGWVSYDAAPAFDPVLQVRSDAGILAHWCFIHPRDVQTGPAFAQAVGTFEVQAPWRDETSDAAFNLAFGHIRDAIEQGRYYQVNYTTRLRSSGSGEPYALFLRLYQAQPGTQAVYIDSGDAVMMSLSPELFFSWEGEQLVTEPMKGTRPVSEDASSLLQDNEKERAENVMIVDLLRNDLSRVALPGSVKVPSLFDVHHFQTVSQMTSTVVARTRPGTTLWSVFEALFPCGSVTGAPKAETMKHIVELESSPRGLYCGAVGVISPGQTLRFSVAIRTPVWFRSTGRLEYGVGSGITWYANAPDERQEWRIKTRFLHRASAAFSLLETLRLEDGVFRHLDAHGARLKANAGHWGYPWDKERIDAALNVLSSQFPTGCHRVRLALDSLGEPHLQCSPHTDVQGPVKVALVRGGAVQWPEFRRYKTDHRPDYDALSARFPDCFDVWLVHHENETEPFVTEGCRTNVLAKRDGIHYTPEKRDDFLWGVGIDQWCAQHPVQKVNLTVDTLLRADTLWCVNSLRGLVEVAQVVDENGQLLWSMKG